MSLRNVSARLVASEDTGDVRAVEVFGKVLTEDFSDIEVDDNVFAKLSGNPHIELKGGKAKGGKAAPAEEPQPE